MTNVSSLLSSLYGNSGSATSTTLTPTVLARVDQVLSQQKGVITKLNNSLAGSQAKLSGLGQLQSALGAFQDIAEGLAGAGLNTSATVSTKNVLGAATTAGAAAGTYKIEVSQLAQGQILNSAAADSADAKIGTGSPAQIKVGDKTITIDSRNNTLNGIADALKKEGIQASVIKSDKGFALQIQSESGDGKELKFAVSGDAAVKDLFGKLTESQKAQDAVLTVDGKEIKSADNNIEDAIKGVTLSLQGKGKTDVTVASDNTQIAKNVSAFVAGFNSLSDRLAALQKGDLKDDNALKQVSGQLEQLLKTGGGSSAAKLADAGVTFENGKLKLDEKKLNAAIAADPAGVSKLFTNEGKGIADQIDTKIDALTGTTGTIRREVNQVGKDLVTLSNKKNQLAQTLTNQANALAAFYTQQEQQGSSSALPGYNGPSSLFDMLA